MPNQYSSEKIVYHCSNPKCKKKMIYRPCDIRQGRGKYCSHKCFGESSRIDPIARFWKAVDKNGPIPNHCPTLGNCWVWTKSTKKYGRFCVNGQKHTLVHRFSWEIHNGPIPKEIPVWHICNNGLCVNPSHLFLGTVSSNAKDIVQRKRRRRRRKRA